MERESENVERLALKHFKIPAKLTRFPKLLEWYLKIKKCKLNYNFEKKVVEFWKGDKKVSEYKYNKF